MKRKGFTVVELVIVIAVVATLAAVLIPTFSSIIKNANITSDTQAVRNMNTFLSSEVAKGTAPKGGDELITTLEENGFSRFRPQTRFYTFYWLRHKNVIVLADDAGDPVFPDEYSDERFDRNNWLNLEEAKYGEVTLPTELPEQPEVLRDFTVSLTQSGASGIDFGITPTVREGDTFHKEIVIPNEVSMRYRIKKVTVLMEDRDGSYKIDIPVENGKFFDGSYNYGEHPVVDIPCVTGNISINVSLKEFCCITIKAKDPSHLSHPDGEYRIWCEKGRNPIITEYSLKGGSRQEHPWLAEQYTITAATVYNEDQNLVLIEDAWDKDIQSIHHKDFTVTSDVVIEFETKEIGYTVTLVVKSQKHDVLHTETIEVPYDSETQSGACSFNLPADLWDKEVNTSFIYPQPKNNGDGDDMTPTYKREGNSINVSNIKYDFTLTYFFQIPEAD